MPERLGQDFFARDTRKVARDLLGKWLVHRLEDGRCVAGRICETEAYHGPDDGASHARFGPTPRAAIMFGAPGRAYVYLIYGLHHCLNFVTADDGFPAAVLVRGLDRLEGVEGDARGPGRLTRLLGIRRELHNGLDVTGAEAALWVEDRGEARPRIETSPRVGVDYAGAWARRPWRYVVASPRRPRRG